MRMLLAAGADTRTPDTRTKLVTAAYFAPTSDVREVLKAAGVVLTSARDLKGPVLNCNRGDVATVRHLLSAGVDPKEEVALNTVSLPSSFMAAREGQLAALKAFVDAGMDPNFKASRGWTALTMAPAPAAAATPRTPIAAVERAVAMLQPAGPAFSNRTKCNSCHNQNIPGLAITLAQRHGVTIDQTLANHSMSATNQQWRARRESMLLGETNNGGFQPNSTYTLLEMAEGHLPPTAISDILAIGLASKQNADGSWSPGNEIRPPLNGGPLTGTALAVRGLREYTPPGHRAGMQPRLARALGWLRGAQPRDTQEQALKMLGLL